MRMRMIHWWCCGVSFRIETTWQGHTPRIMVSTKSGNCVHLRRWSHIPLFRPAMPLLGFEPATFQPGIRNANHYAMHRSWWVSLFFSNTPLHCQLEKDRFRSWPTSVFFSPWLLRLTSHSERPTVFLLQTCLCEHVKKMKNTGYDVRRNTLNNTMFSVCLEQKQCFCSLCDLSLSNNGYGRSCICCSVEFKHQFYTTVAVVWPLHDYSDV